MITNIVPETLRGIPLFASLTRGEVRELLDMAEECAYPEGAVIFGRGSLERALYVILEGQVEISLPASALRETLVATLGPGSVFGESTFFHAAPHGAAARALTPVYLLRLTRKGYDELMRARSLAVYKLATNAAEILAARLQATDRWIEQILEQEEDARIAASWREFRHKVGFNFEPDRWGP